MVTGLPGCPEHAELGHEPRRQGQAAHGEEQRGEHRGQERLTAGQANERIDVRARAGRSRHCGDDAERRHDLDGVRRQVEPHARRAFGACNQARQDEAGMCDAGVRQHPSDVVLNHREDRPEDHRQRRDPGHDRTPRTVELGEGEEQQPSHGRKAPQLRHRCHVSDDPRRRTLVDVGRPTVERSRRDLEGEADDHQRKPDREYRRPEDDRARQVALMTEQIELSVPGEGECDPVDEHGRGHRSQQEVLDGGLVGLGALPGDPGEHVQRD